MKTVTTRLLGKLRGAWRCGWRAGLALSATASVVAIGYVLLCPYPVGRLAPGAAGPLEVTDRHGTLLRTFPAAAVPDAVTRAGRRAWVPLDRVASHAVLTLLASEDQRFFHHRGVDPLGVARAVWLNLRSGKLAYGGSTITMQLCKLLHSPGRPRTMINKVRESLHAARLELAMGKRAILEQYVNRVYFGHGAYGIEAAARTYFGKPAASLSVGEATLLAVLPRGPRYYDPLRPRSLRRARARRDHLFSLLVAQGRITAGEVRRARAQPIEPRLHREPFFAPHFVDWVVTTLPAEQRRRGGRLRTTLDLGLQRALERAVREHLATQRERGIGDAGLVVLDAQTSEVLAMVGSSDYRRSQINIVTRRRHPGSALKPFVYATAIEALGDGPGSVTHDVRDVRGSAYQPPRVSQREHGPVRYREALAGSYNLAAVHVLERVGVARVLTRLRRAGLGPLDGGPSVYGLRLALGSAKVRLLDLAASYGLFVRGGAVRAPSGLLGLDRPGTRERPWRRAARRSRRVFSPQTAWLVTDILADPQARRPMFGQELPVDLPYRVAVKTGTARGFADTVAVGATRELVVAAWAGNLDGKPGHGVQAMRVAAPLVRAGLLAASGGRRLTLPPRPAYGLQRVILCPLSGKLAGPDCPHRTREHVLTGHGPTERCGWHHRDAAGHPRVSYPPEIDRWAERLRTRGGRHRIQGG